MKMNSSTILIILLVAVLALVCGCSNNETSNKTSNYELEAWNRYEGEIAHYKVIIVESKRNGMWSRKIDLNILDESSPFCEISARDYNGDGKFEEIRVRRSYPDNLVSTHSKQQDKWYYARARLYEAMGFVHEQSCLVYAFEDLKVAR